MMDEYGGEQGAGQSCESMAPRLRRDVVRTSSLRPSDNENICKVGAERPEPNKLSRNVAPSGLEPVVPGIVDRMTEFAGTGMSVS